MELRARLVSDLVGLMQRVMSVDVPPESITEETRIAADLMIDSISLVSLVVLCEEHFGISLADQAEAVANIDTVGDAVSLLAAAMECSTPV